MTESLGTKVCTLCRHRKGYDAFTVCQTTRDGFHTRCKRCRSMMMQQRQRAAVAQGRCRTCGKRSVQRTATRTYTQCAVCLDARRSAGASEMTVWRRWALRRGVHVTQVRREAAEWKRASSPQTWAMVAALWEKMRRMYGTD